MQKSGNIICCFGELLLRFSPRMQGVFIKESLMPMYVGGAELNVATALANWGLPVNYISALPDNFLSKEILDAIASKNIAVNNVILCGERIGIYYLPQGADMKHNAVIYDRNHSSFSSLYPGQINWDKALENIAWLHVSAISPALSAQAAAVCLEAVKAASDKDITVSIDLNYRAKLWQYGVNPIDIMPEIVQHCDVVMGNVWSAESLLQVKVDSGFSHSGATKNTYLLQADKTADEIMKRFPKCKFVANTFRFDENDGIRYFASLKSKEANFHSTTYHAQNIVDKVGSGDCFMGGLIYGIFNNHPTQNIIEFAAAAAFGKLHIKGDTTSNTVDDIKKIITANG